MYFNNLEWLLDDPIIEAILRLFIGRKRWYPQFGALLVNSHEIHCVSRNRKVTKDEPWRRQGYHNHAEAMCLFLTDYLGILRPQSTVYIVGRPIDGIPFIHPSSKELRFTCSLCSKLLLEFCCNVALPTTKGWQRLAPEVAAETAEQFKREKDNSHDGRIEEREYISPVFVASLKKKILDTSPKDTIKKLRDCGFKLNLLTTLLLMGTGSCYLENDHFLKVINQISKGLI